MSNLHDHPSRMERLRKRISSFKFSSKVIFIIMGIASSVWFLIRVIPKPQRAGYPCMRAAAPVMSGFIIYLLSLGGSVLFFRETFTNLKKAKYWSAIGAFFICLVLIVVFNLNDVKKIYSNVLGIKWTKGVLPDAPNTPMGTPWGIHPGRVAWTRSPNATNENCTNTITDAYFMAKNNNQDTINKLANKAVMIVAGKNTVAASWDTIFKNFNKRKTGTATGYISGQKIFIKVNNGQAGWAINTDLSEKGNPSVTGVSNAAMSNTSPEAVLAFLVQLIDSCGIAQGDIMIGEPMTHVYKSMYDVVHPKYPNVKLMDKDSITRINTVNVNTVSLGRTKSKGWKSNVITFSDNAKVMTSAGKDDMMNEMYNADYLINIAALKAHARSGVTFCAKNHFGSSTHGGSYSADRLHSGSINPNTNNDDLTNARGSYHMYRVLTDLMGHEKLGRNTVLFVVDGLWGGIEATDMPVKWQMAPFNNDFPSSLFVSQDEIAVESVCLDFLRAEADGNTNFNNRPFFPAVDDYLHQGATKANWPDSIVSLSNKWYAFAGYDPEGDGTFMPSLGVHEHWNNPTNKQYSRNLYNNGTGIELKTYPSNLVANGTATALNLTVTVTDGTSPLQNAIVIVNGSNYITDSEGKAVIGNLKTTSGLSYTISKKGYTPYTGTVDISADAEVTKALSNGSVSVKSTEASFSQLTLSAYPNPLTYATVVSYQIKSNMTISLFLISMDGKIVKQINKGKLSAGLYSDKINTNDLNRGTYICILKTEKEIKTIRLVK